MSIVDLIFPKMCAGCGREGEYVCHACLTKMRRPEQICPMCTRPSLDGWTHPLCKKKEGIERLIIGLEYHGIVQRCLKKVKYKNSWDIVEYLCDLADFGVIDDSIITSVPMWRGKERERGFNQARELADCFAHQYKLRNISILVRRRPTKPMFGLSKTERQENIGGAFEVIEEEKAKIMGQKVILVDDVWTTGATMRECSRQLKKAGAREIWAVALAK